MQESIHKSANALEVCGCAVAFQRSLRKEREMNMIWEDRVVVSRKEYKLALQTFPKKHVKMMSIL